MSKRCTKKTSVRLMGFSGMVKPISTSGCLEIHTDCICSMCRLYFCQVWQVSSKYICLEILIVLCLRGSWNSPLVIRFVYVEWEYIAGLRPPESLPTCPPPPEGKESTGTCQRRFTVEGTYPAGSKWKGERGSSVPVLWEISAVTGVRVTLLPLLPERQGCETEVRPEGEPLLSENYEEINKHKLQVCAQLACSPWEDDSYVIPSNRQMTFGVSVCPQQYRLMEDWVPSLALFLTCCHNKRLSF